MFREFHLADHRALPRCRVLSTRGTGATRYLLRPLTHYLDRLRHPLAERRGHGNRVILAKASGRFMTPDEQQLAESVPTVPVIALLPWGDLIEDFLDEIGVSLEDFCTKMTGGWLFGYVNALRLRGIGTTIFCFSDRVQRTVHKIHEPTKAEFLVMPASAIHRRLRRRTKDPYALTAKGMFGPRKRFSVPIWRIAHLLAPYLATPVFALAREIR